MPLERLVPEAQEAPVAMAVLPHSVLSRQSEEQAVLAEVVPLPAMVEPEGQGLEVTIVLRAVTVLLETQTTMELKVAMAGKVGVVVKAVEEVGVVVQMNKLGLPEIHMAVVEEEVLALLEPAAQVAQGEPEPQGLS